MHVLKYILLIVLSCSVSCKESYDLPVDAARTNSLVVEGVINNNGITSIKLSRSAELADTSTIMPETAAQVIVQSEGGISIILNEIQPGTYENSTSIDASQNYRLHIRTSAGKEYASDYVPVIIGPEIDSISWVKKDGNVQVYANTHDESNATRYYRWTYKETWEFHSPFISFGEYVNHQVVYRIINDIFTCYKNEDSKIILNASSAKLVNDIVSLFPITNIPNGSKKISQLYSILVNQYALTKDAYEYWDQLKKNTEKLGTIFDPQPSANKTNIHSLSDPNEIVIGYISASNIVSQRLFIYNQDVQPWSYGTNCLESLIPLDSMEYYFGTNNFIPTREKDGPPPKPWYGSVAYCVDCTLEGSNIKPTFWPR